MGLELDSQLSVPSAPPTFSSPNPGGPPGGEEARQAPSSRRGKSQGRPGTNQCGRIRARPPATPSTGAHRVADHSHGHRSTVLLVELPDLASKSMGGIRDGEGLPLRLLPVPPAAPPWSRRAAPEKSGLHECGQADRVIALESCEGSSRAEGLLFLHGLEIDRRFTV